MNRCGGIFEWIWRKKREKSVATGSCLSKWILYASVNLCVTDWIFFSTCACAHVSRGCSLSTLNISLFSAWGEKNAYAHAHRLRLTYINIFSQSLTHYTHTITFAHTHISHLCSHTHIEKNKSQYSTTTFWCKKWESERKMMMMILRWIESNGSTKGITCAENEILKPFDW